ncbi:MAG: FapA family protein [Alkalispirochaeta sp.]
MDRDGFVEIFVGEDGMTVTATFLPPMGSGRLLEPDVVHTLLESRKIVHGVDTEAIGEAVFFVNTERRLREDVIIARGTPPESARPAHYELIASADKSHPSWGAEERAAYKKVSLLPVIHQGEVVARLNPEKAGIPGMTVSGAEIPFDTESVSQLQPGNHTRLVDDQVIAEIGGQLQIRDTAFHIEDRLEIGGTVGFETGSIEFPGDVVLRGEVKDGFHIWAGRSISSTVTVDVSEVYCRGDFVSTAGIIGRGKALLRCGGKVQARFASTCFVESKSSVFLDHYVYQSHIGSQDRLATGKTGRIVGGVVTTVNGVRAHALGNQASVATLVRTGIDFIAERKLRLITEKHQAVTLRLQRLEVAAGEDPSDRQIEILHQLEDRRNRLAMEMGDVAEALDANEDATVAADGPVYPGVRVQICRSSYQVEQVLTNVRFRLDKASGQVVWESLADEK